MGGCRYVEGRGVYRQGCRCAGEEAGGVYRLDCIREGVSVEGMRVCLDGLNRGGWGCVYGGLYRGGRGAQGEVVGGYGENCIEEV